MRNLLRRSHRYMWLLAAWVIVFPAHAREVEYVKVEEELSDFIRWFSVDQNGVSRFYDLPWAEVRHERMEKLFKNWEERLGKLDFDQLKQPGKIDYLLLRNKLNWELHRVNVERTRLKEMDELLPFRKSIQELERTRWLMESSDPQKSASVVNGLIEQAKNIRKRVEKGKKEKEKSKEDQKEETEESAALKVAPLLAKRTASTVNDLRGTLKEWFTFYDGYQPEFSWWVRKPYEELRTALEEYGKYLREEVAGLKGKDEDPLIGEALGEEALGWDIAAEMLPYSAEELIAIGEKEFAWCEEQMRKAAREIGYSENWKDALAKVKSQHVPPGKQDELVAEEGRRATKFVKEKNLVTVTPLCEETWRLSMISPESQKTMPYVAYGGQSMLVAYAKEEMKHEDKLMAMRGNNVHFTRITTPHELIPGHHLQGFTAARNRSYRGMFSTPFLVEGWPLYWELKLWDLNYAQSPEDKIGMLFWRMHRCARIIVSLKFHLGKMTPKEMVSFLVDRVGHEKLGATSEVRRFIGGDYSPLYQCGYMIGGLQLRALHKEIVGSGKMTEREFNDTVLTYNAIPIEMIRAGMLDSSLARDWKPSWKFMGEVRTPGNDDK